MIRIGCTSFNEHESLTGKKETTLFEYAGHFPLVEMDTGFYSIPSYENVEKWVGQVPDNFRFIMKIHQTFTKHQEASPAQLKELADQLSHNLQPMVKSGKLFCLLAQFPPYFACTKENVRYLRFVRKLFSTFPFAIEFRNPSWYDSNYIKGTKEFMRTQKIALVIVDEPKKLSSTVPLDPAVTNDVFAFFRFHGRNDNGWLATGPQARQLRTNYCYQEDELKQLAQLIISVEKKVKEVGIIFNNNAGGDAAENAKSLQQELGIDYNGLNPSQLELF